MTTFGCVCIHCDRPYLAAEWKRPFYCLDCRRIIAFYRAFNLFLVSWEAA